MSVAEISVLISSILMVLSIVGAGFSIPKWVEGKFVTIDASLCGKFSAINEELKEINEKLGKIKEQVVSLSATSVKKDDCRAEHKEIESKMTDLKISINK